MLRRTGVAERLNNNLDELRRRAELESLRPFCIDSGCFAPSANPKKAAITMEELKKLARSWKLHGECSSLALTISNPSLIFLYPIL